LAGRRIEFLGVSGAGKSTLYREAIDELGQVGVDAVHLADATYASLRAGMQDRIVGPVLRYTPRRIGRKYYRQLALRSQDRELALRRFMLENPETMGATLAALDDRRDFDPDQDLLLSWILELFWKFQLTNNPRGAGPCLVLDEGFANRAISIFGFRYTDADEALLRRYIESIPKPDLVIAVTADAEEAASRSTGRGRFGHLSEEDAVEHTRDAARCAAATSLLLKERGVDVEEVVNESSLAAASVRVRQIIRDWLDPS
jgi:thymidylate kinase